MSDLTLGVALTSDGNYGKTYTTGYWISAHYFVPTTCEYPDRVLDLVEFLASPGGPGPAAQHHQLRVPR